MNKVMLILCLLVAFNASFAIDLDYVRTNYDKAVKNEKLCKSLMEGLSENTASPVHKAYLGALQTIWANHTFNPISKLNTFNKGKKNIENAVKSEPDNIEIRFVRLSIQKNCPAFLKYNAAIAEDTTFIEDNKHKISSPILRKMVNEILQKEKATYEEIPTASKAAAIL